MAAIAVQGVTRIFGTEVKALDNVDLVVADGEFLVLVGPSGCGKSTLLRAIAGLEQIDGGRVLIGDEDVTKRSARDRNIAMVFQSYALYPQMTVRQNLEFGLRSRGMTVADRRVRVNEVAATLGLEPLLDRRPGELSGGQRQRVAMGRAIVRRPTAFLMDEPLSNLDAKLRVSMRAELAKMHDRLGVTTVYVTHDQVEAMTLGDRVAVMRDGVIQQCDTPRQVFDRPANLFVAAFIGSPSMNLASAEVGWGSVRFGGWELPLPEDRLLRAGRVTQVIVGLRPTDFAHAVGAPSAWPRVRVTATGVEELGAERTVHFRIDSPRLDTFAVRAANDVGNDDQFGLFADESGASFSAQLGGREHIEIGTEIDLAIDPEAMHCFDPTTGEALR
jgi:multiple sugar transport system ATP-binding protein